MSDGCSCRLHEGFQLAAGVGTGRLVDDLRNSLIGERRDPLTDLALRSTDRAGRQHVAGAGVPRGGVGRVEAYAVLLVDGEVAILFRRVVDHRKPLAAAGHALYRGLELVSAVIGEHRAWPSGCAN